MSVFNINFEYRSVSEITELCTKLLDFGIFQIIFLILGIALVIFSIMYLFPALRIVFNKRIQEKQRLSKKQALKQILIQKEIENEMEKEIELEAQKNHKT